MKKFFINFLTLIAVTAFFFQKQALAIDIPSSSISVITQSLKVYEKYEMHFLVNTGAQYPFFAYEPNAVSDPSGLGARGVTVEAIINNTATGKSYRQPAFYMTETVQNGTGSGMYFTETGKKYWVIRFSPPETGSYNVSLTATDASGTFSISNVASFSPQPPSKHGFIKVSNSDTRYFEFSDGSLFFPLGPAWGTNYSQYAGSGLNFERPWMAGSGAYSSNFARWISSAQIGGNEGFITQLTYLEHAPGSELSYEFYYPQAERTWLSNWNNSMFGPKLTAGKLYHADLTLKTAGLTGPRNSSYPWGFTVKTGPTIWGFESKTPDEFDGLARNYQEIIPHQTTNLNWVTVSNNFTASADQTDLFLYLDNVSAGQAYVDFFSVKECLTADCSSLGGEIIEGSKADLHTYVDPKPAAFFDWQVNEGAQNGVYFKYVVHDKNDWIQNHLLPDGTWATPGNGYFQAENTKAAWLLKEWYRYIVARWSYSTSVHSLEQVNEADPNDTAVRTTANTLAGLVNSHNTSLINPHLATTSFWCCSLVDGLQTWNSGTYPNIDYADLHEYSNSPNTVSGIYTSDDAGWMAAMSAAVKTKNLTKPLIWAEHGYTDASGTLAALVTPNPGVWYHNLLWGQLDSSGLSAPNYWFSQHINNLNIPLTQIAGPFNSFVSGLDLNKGGYTDATATVTNNTANKLRVIGQKNQNLQKAILWVQNMDHTWQKVLNQFGANDGDVSLQSGTVSLAMPNATYTVEKWDTYTGSKTSQTVSVTNGNLSLSISGLGKDQAFKIYSGNVSVSTPTTNIIQPTATPIPTQPVPPTPTPTLSTSNIITINSSKTYQTFTGWEATDWAGSPGMAGYPGYVPQLLNNAVNDYGLTRIRLEAGAGIQNDQDYFTQYQNGQITENKWSHCYRREPLDVNSFFWSSLDYNIDEMVIPLRNLLSAKGEKLHVNLNFVSFNTVTSTDSGACPPGHTTGFRQYNYPNKYAQFMLSTFQHMQTKYGFVPDTIELILEPDNTSFDGTKMGNALKATQALLSLNGFNPKYILPSTMNMGSALSPYLVNIAGVVGDAFINQWTQEISYHRYGGGDPLTIGNASRTRGIGASMLECWIGAGCSGDYSALYTDLTSGMNTAWQDSTLYGIYKVNSSGVVSLDDHSKYIRQFTRYIRPGAVRIDASWNDLNKTPAVAFQNSDGKYVAVVRASGKNTFAINNLPAGTYGIKYVTQTSINNNNGNPSQYPSFDIDAGDYNLSAGSYLTTTIPEAGVITIYQKVAGISITNTPVPTQIQVTPAPTNIPCTIISADWSPTGAIGLGSTVNLILNAAGSNCLNQSAVLTVQGTGAIATQPAPAKFGSNNIASTPWTPSNTGSYTFNALFNTQNFPSNSTLSATSNIITTPTVQPVSINDWPQIMGNAQHSGYVADTYAGPFAEKWRIGLSKQTTSTTPAFTGVVAGPISTRIQPVAAYGLIFLPSTDGNLYAVNGSDGTIAWKYPVGAAMVNAASVDTSNGTILVGATDGKLYALNTSGALKWVYQTSAKIRIAPVISGGVVYIANDNGDVYGLNSTTGTLIWGPKNVGAPVLDTPAFYNGNLYLGTFAAKAYALAGTNGNIVWGPVQLKGQGFRDRWVVAGNGKVIFTAVPFNGSNASQSDGAAFIKSISSYGQSQPWSTERTAIINHLNQNPHYQTTFVLDAATGNPINNNEPIPMLYLGGSNSEPANMVVLPNGNFNVIYRNNLEGVSGNNGCDATCNYWSLYLGEYNPALSSSGNDFANLDSWGTNLTGSPDINKKLFFISDESSALLRTGSIIYDTSSRGIVGFDTVQKTIFPVATFNIGTGGMYDSNSPVVLYPLVNDINGWTPPYPLEEMDGDGNSANRTFIVANGMFYQLQNSTLVAITATKK